MEILKGWMVYTYEAGGWIESDQYNNKLFDTEREAKEYMINEFKIESKELEKIKNGELSGGSLVGSSSWNVNYTEIEYIVIDGIQYYPLKKLFES